MNVYEKAKEFKSKYPFTVAWRLKKNASVIERHLNPDEKVLYVFAAQKTEYWFDFFSTAVIALTNKRILIGRKRVVFGYFLCSVMPYMYNDLKVRAGLLWGDIHIDTVKELIVLSHLSKSSLDEIETAISTYMIEMKKEYPDKKEENIPFEVYGK